jgi:hypothetical protein
MSRLLLVSLALLAAPGSTPAQGELKKLHVLLVLDTSDRTLGDIVKRDGDIIERLLRENIPPARLTIDVLKGEQATKENIQNHYARLGKVTEDALLFYFSGHGEVLNDETNHRILLQGQGLERVPRATIRESVKNCQPGLALLLTDACACFAPQPGAFHPPKGVKDATELAPGFRELFFKPRGIVDINSALAGSLAWSDTQDGSIFTNTLADLLTRHAARPDPTWMRFYAELKGQTQKDFAAWRDRQIQLAGGKSLKVDTDLLAQKLQTPQAFYLPGDRFGVLAGKSEKGGVMVAELRLNSPLREAGIQRGERIVRINGQKVGGTGDFSDLLDRVREPLTFEVENPQGKMRTVRVTR